MIRNPILHDTFVRLYHIVLCILLGMAYAICFGIAFHLSTLSIAADTMVSMLLFFGEAVMLWSVFTFSRLEVLDFYQSVIINIIYALLAVIIMLAIEYMILTVVSDNIDLFLSSLPARMFSLFVIYVSFRRYYIINRPEEDNYSQEDNLKVDTYSEKTAPVETIERITVKVGTKIKVIPIKDLICLKAEDDYVSIITAEGHWLKSERLKDYELLLPADRFVRIHRSCIVNISMITKIERYGQKQLLVLSNGQSIRISSTGYKLLRAKLNL